MNILLDFLFAKSSPIYEEWLKEGIINDSFSANFTQERDYSFLQVGGDTFEPEKLKDKIIDLLSSIDSYSIDEESFQRILRKNIGVFITIFNSPESIANLFSRYYFEGIMIFDFLDIFAQLTLQDIEDLRKLFKKELMSSFIVTSK